MSEDPEMQFMGELKDIEQTILKAIEEATADKIITAEEAHKIESLLNRLDEIILADNIITPEERKFTQSLKDRAYKLLTHMEE